MQTRHAHAVVVAALLLAACGHSPRVPPAPTFNKDVAPILFAHCVTCHRPGQHAVPFPLIQYADVKRRADKIARATVARHMPPWLPDPGDPPFVGERRLGDDHIDTIQRWVKGGTIEGETGDLPRAPVFAETWQLGEPDVVVSMARAYVLKAGDHDVFRNVVLRLTLPSDRFVRAVEFRPGVAPIHHAIMRIDRTRASRARDGVDGAPGFDGMVALDVQNPDGHFIGWAPGRGPIIAPEGMPWRLEHGSDLVVELHLLPGKVPIPVEPLVGLFFTDRPPTHVPVMVVMGSKAIDIPAGQRDYAFTDSYVLPAHRTVK